MEKPHRHYVKIVDYFLEFKKTYLLFETLEFVYKISKSITTNDFFKCVKTLFIEIITTFLLLLKVT